MSQMEPEVRTFLQKIGWTLGAGLFWLFINVLVGLKWEFAIWQPGHEARSIGFYIWFVVSLLLLLRLYYYWWKKHF
jgi:hypothetical protein